MNVSLFEILRISLIINVHKREEGPNDQLVNHTQQSFDGFSLTIKEQKKSFFLRVRVCVFISIRGQVGWIEESIDNTREWF